MKCMTNWGVSTSQSNEQPSNLQPTFIQEMSLICLLILPTWWIIETLLEKVIPFFFNTIFYCYQKRNFLTFDEWKLNWSKHSTTSCISNKHKPRSRLPNKKKCQTDPKTHSKPKLKTRSSKEQFPPWTRTSKKSAKMKLDPQLKLYK